MKFRVPLQRYLFETVMLYPEAIRIANEIKDELAPFCLRLEIAGSVRRHKEICNDIEICAIVKPYSTGTNDLFAMPPTGIATVLIKWQRIKGQLGFDCRHYSAYRLCKLDNGIEAPEQIDLFFASPQNFGGIFLIRTGNWVFSKAMMGQMLPKQGYVCKDGYIYYGYKEKGETVLTSNIPRNVPEEKDVFKMTNYDYLEPWQRSWAEK